MTTGLGVIAAPKTPAASRSCKVRAAKGALSSPRVKAVAPVATVQFVLVIGVQQGVISLLRCVLVLGVHGDSESIIDARSVNICLD